MVKMAVVLLVPGMVKCLLNRSIELEPPEKSDWLL